MTAARQVTAGRLLSILWTLTGCAGTSSSITDATMSLGPTLEIGVDLPDLPHVEPVIAVNPADPRNIVVATIVIREPLSEAAFYDSWTVHALVSHDAGATWVRHRLPGLASVMAADPWLAWDDAGTLTLSVLADVDTAPDDRWMRVLLYQSVDGGRAWSGPTEVPSGLSGSLDHPVIDVAGARSFVFASGNFSEITIAGSAAAGDALEARDEFRPDSLNNNLGSGVGFDDGRFVFTYFSMSRPQPSALWAVRPSDDAGYEVSVVTSEHIPVGFPQMAVDRSGSELHDRLYAVWTRSNDRPDVLLARSDDFGASWSRPVRVHADTTRAARPLSAVAVNGAGIVLVGWVDGRHHEGDCWDLYAAASLDGGLTFLPERRLTAETSCPGAPGNRNGGAVSRWRWGGDYFGVDAGGDAFYVVWADSRTGVYQLYTRGIRVESRPERGRNESEQR